MFRVLRSALLLSVVFSSKVVILQAAPFQAAYRAIHLLDSYMVDVAEPIFVEFRQRSGGVALLIFVLDFGKTHIDGADVLVVARFRFYPFRGRTAKLVVSHPSNRSHPVGGVVIRGKWRSGVVNVVLSAKHRL